MSPEGRVTPPKELFGHPAGLTVLFLTETWEVFCFYGMRTLLVYYMTKSLLIHQQHASIIYGSYTGLVYLTPLLGGWVADRWIGRRFATLTGGLLMAVGNFLMLSAPLFYVALATICIGNGLFLPSLPSQIAELYSADDPRCSSAYSVYYAGKNLGALIAPLICGSIGEIFGWRWGFGVAGLGMLLGLSIYWLGRNFLPNIERANSNAVLTTRGAFSVQLLPRWLLFLKILLVVILFRGFYEQIGNTIALWIDTSVDRQILGWEIPRTWFQSLNPLLVLLITPLLVRRWTRRAQEGKETTPLHKMALGSLFVAAAYVVLGLVAHTPHAQGASWLWVVCFVVGLTMGELFVFPIGIGLFGKLAPPGLSATTLAAWYFASFGGNLLAGVIGTLWSRVQPEQFFTGMACLAGVTSLFFYGVDRSAQRVVTQSLGEAA